MYCGWELIREVISVDANICCKSRPPHFIFRPLPYIFGLFSPHPESWIKILHKKDIPTYTYMDIVWQHKGLLICWHSVVQIIKYSSRHHILSTICCLVLWYCFMWINMFWKVVESISTLPIQIHLSHEHHLHHCPTFEEVESDLMWLHTVGRPTQTSAWWCSSHPLPQFKASPVDSFSFLITISEKWKLAPATHCPTLEDPIKPKPASTRNSTSIFSFHDSTKVRWATMSKVVSFWSQVDVLDLCVINYAVHCRHLPSGWAIVFTNPPNPSSVRNHNYGLSRNEYIPRSGSPYFCHV